MTDSDYELGRRDGRIESIESILAQQSERIDGLERSLRLQERIVYALMGAISLIQFIPEIKNAL